MQVAIARESPDRAIVDFVARHGIVTIDHVIDALGISQATAYRHTAACVEGRLLERHQPSHLKFSLLRATGRGLRYVGLGLNPVRLSVRGIEHRLRCASTAQLLAQEYPGARILSERELMHAERLANEPLFSAPLPNSGAHRPDLAVQTDKRTLVAEVELCAKNPQRLERLLRAWRDCTAVSEVLYFCEAGGTWRGVERIVDKLHAQDRIKILEAPPLRRPGGT